jgi:RNA polymerase sigma-70 factor (ECF subfamily)
MQQRAEVTLVATDAELIAAYRNSSDSAALDALVRRHIGYVRAIIYPMVLDDAVADDLTQDTLVRAMRGLAGFRQKSEFSTWLYTIAMNCVRSHFNRRQPRLVMLDETICASTNERPEVAAIGKELDQAIGSALEQLTPKLRATIVLVSLGGLDAAKAAAVEGCTAATIYSRLHEARQQLKRLLKGHLSP